MDRLIDLVRSFLTPPVVVGMTVASLVLFVLGVVGVPLFVARLPADYFSRWERRELGIEPAQRPAWRVALRIARNALGVLVLVAGIAMLALPGQGLITIFVALLLLDFPGKRRFERRLIRFGPVLRGLNSLRKRAGKPPLHVPDVPPE